MQIEFFDCDYFQLPYSVLGKINSIIVCKDSIHKLGEKTWQVVKVITPVCPPQLLDVFPEKENAILFAKEYLKKITYSSS